MSDSVGQISLDLGLNDITEKQIENISHKIKTNITNALSNLGNIGNVNKTLDSIENMIKKMIDSMHDEIKSNLLELKDYIENIFSNIKVKNPMENFLNKDSIATNKNDITPKTPRGPPISVKVPKVDLSNNSEYIKSQIENLTIQLDQIGAKADEERYKIKDLRKEIEKLSKPTGNKAVDFINQEQIKKLQLELSKAEENLNKFASKADKTAFTIADHEKKIKNLGDTSEITNKKVSVLGNIFSNLNKSISNSVKDGIGNIKNNIKNKLNFTDRLNKEGSNAKSFFSKGFNGFGSKLKRIGNTITYTGRSFLNMGNMISTGLMTNRQFTHSLNQIRTNLMVAFMPIYQAVLPALNALMSGLATATAYIATFISAIFGKTYKQSFNAAKGLSKARAAMGAYGKSTKKAGSDSKKAAKDMESMKGALMGFDEINQLDLDKGKKDKGGAGKDSVDGMPAMVMPDVDVSPASAAGKTIEDMAQKVRAVLSTIFQPFKAAWVREGAATITSIKYALHGIWGLIKSIGYSFMEVWTNGTGEAILVVILQILQNIFNIIGDIGITFANAWNAGGIGTAIVQSLANAFLNVLTLIKHMGDSLRQVWGEVGPGVAKTFMAILHSTAKVLENLTQKLVYVWDNGGSHLFQGFIRLGAKIFELAGYIYTQFVVPMVNWFVNNIAPVIAIVADKVGIILDVFSGLITWLMGSGKPVLDIIITAFRLLGGSIGAVKIGTSLATKAFKLFGNIMSIIKVGSRLLGTAIAFLSNPIGIAIVAIGAIIAVGVLLYKNWNTIKAKSKEVWGSIKKTFNNFRTWLGSVFVTDWSRKFGCLGSALNIFLTLVRNIFNSVKRIFGGIIDFVAGVFTGNWRRAWQGVVDIFGGIFDGIKVLAKVPLNAVIGLINSAIGGFNKIKIPDWVPGVGGKGVNIPKIPMLAKGGIIDQPTLSMVGEAGKEAVVPLENNTGWMDKISEAVANAILAAMQFNDNKANNDNKGDTVMQLDGVTFARLIKSYTDKENQRIGNNVIIQTT